MEGHDIWHVLCVGWTFQTYRQWGFDTPKIHFGWSITLAWLTTTCFNLSIMWMTLHVTYSRQQLSKGSEEWTVRGSLSHIDAKYTLWRAKPLAGCSHFSVMSLVKGYNYQLNDFSFCSALLIEQYFGIWSSLYLQLLQYFILFCYLYSDQPLWS